MRASAALFEIFCIAQKYSFENTLEHCNFTCSQVKDWTVFTDTPKICENSLPLTCKFCLHSSLKNNVKSLRF